MSKQLPYYQFEVAEYLAGDIMICSLEAQGLFSIIKCLYWQKECKLNTKQVLKRYDKIELIEELEEEGCLKIDSDGNLEISFLLSQFQQLKERKTRLSEAGRKGGLKKKEATLKPSLSDDKATLKHLEEKRREEKREEDIKQAEALYSLYPSKTIRNGKECQTKSRDKNIKKLLILLNDKKHTFESLKLAIETELKGKDQKNGIYQFLRGFEVFLNNLPDVDSVDANPHELDEKYIYYQWMNDPSVMARRVLKTEADKMFEGQAMGGYKPKFLKSIKNKKATWTH